MDFRLNVAFICEVKKGLYYFQTVKYPNPLESHVSKNCKLTHVIMSLNMTPPLKLTIKVVSHQHINMLRKIMVIHP